MQPRCLGCAPWAATWATQACGGKTACSTSASNHSTSADAEREIQHRPCRAPFRRAGARPTMRTQRHGMDGLRAPPNLDAPNEWDGTKTLRSRECPEAGWREMLHGKVAGSWAACPMHRCSHSEPVADGPSGFGRDGAEDATACGRPSAASKLFRHIASARETRLRKPPPPTPLVRPRSPASWPRRFSGTC